MLILSVLQIRFRIVLKIQNLLSLKNIKNILHVDTVCLSVKADGSIKCVMEPFIYSRQGEEDNASEDFVQDLQILTNKIYKKYYKFPKQGIMTKEDKKTI